MSADEFEIGDIIKYGFFNNIKVVNKDKLYYTLEDNAGNRRKSYKWLVEKWSKKLTTSNK